MIFRLSADLVFPNPQHAEPDGLLAIGGDLSAKRLVLAYQSGIFPWYSNDTPILWYSPHQRFVLFPQRLKVSKSMHQVLKSGVFTITQNMAFAQVIQACAQTPRTGQDGTWITADMLAAYINLHRQGIAQSVEVWQGETLVGGLYGVEVNNVFCGESMFSRASNASKAALIHLCRSGQYSLIDCQVHTAHLESMGAQMISREEYMQMLHSKH